ncbi:MAG: PilZ domain-containing protein [Candidatus Thiodiazotropha sp.]
MKNRRKHPRLDIDQPAALHIQDHTLSVCQILNFSSGGVYLKSTDNGLNDLLSEGYFAEETCQHAVLKLTPKELKAEVSVVYRHGEGIGLYFSNKEQGQKIFSYLKAQFQMSVDAPLVRFDSAIGSSLMQQMEGMLLDYLHPRFH